MKSETRHKQVAKMIQASLTNLFRNQTTLNLDQFAITTLEGLMLLEREEYLKQHKDGAKDYANGIYTRTFKSLRNNSLQISIPRSRNGNFKPLTLELIKENKERANQLGLLLYRKGLSTRDVSHILDGYFGHTVSRDTINNLASSFQELREAWEKRALDPHYKAIYCDALFTTLKRGRSYTKEALYIIYGVKDDNTRELLLLEVNPTESSHVWGEYLSKLRQRGVQQIDLIVADGLPHFADQAKIQYPQADIQRCVVHLQRNLLNRVRPKDKQAFALGLKEVFDNFESTSSQQNAMQKLQKFVAYWKASYKPLVQKLVEDDYINDYLTYIAYPVGVRRMIYTTNSIENLNRQIRKVIKTKVSFDVEDNLLNLTFMIIKDFEFQNWKRYPLNNFRGWPRFTQ